MKQRDIYDIYEVSMSQLGSSMCRMTHSLVSIWFLISRQNLKDPLTSLFLLAQGVGDGQNADRWKEGVRLHEVTLQNVMLKNVELHEVTLQNFTSNKVVLRCITQLYLALSSFSICCYIISCYLTLEDEKQSFENALQFVIEWSTLQCRECNNGWFNSGRLHLMRKKRSVERAREREGII